MIDEQNVEVVDTRLGPMTLFKHDVCAVSHSLRLYGEWAAHEIDFLARLIPAAATVVDVGAYVGTHALAFSRLVGLDGRVVAIEAQAQSFEVLGRNVARAGASNVVLVHAVAAEADGAMEIAAIDPGCNGSFGSACVRDSLSGHQREAIRCITIDSLELAHCALIKIDAEGTEHCVIAGAHRTLARLSPLVYAECNSVDDGARTFGRLKDRGYRTFVHVVDAFNAGNFKGSDENFFGPAREVAILGVPEAQARMVAALPLGAHELLLEAATLDDIALGLLNKPQYPAEILRGGAAGRSGGAAWLDGIEALRLELAALRREAARHDEGERLRRDDAAMLMAQSAAARADLLQARAEIGALLAAAELERSRERARGMGGFLREARKLSAMLFSF